MKTQAALNPAAVSPMASTKRSKRKKGLTIQGETQTYATITLQNYFRMYDKLAGMTGTAMTEANEFKEIYKLDVLAIPTHRNCQRKDTDDEIYMTEREKYNAIIKEIQEIHGQGRPILIGTESVEVSEKLSRIFRQNKLEHTVFNAKNHAKEAEIIADAGKTRRHHRRHEHGRTGNRH